MKKNTIKKVALIVTATLLVAISFIGAVKLSAQHRDVVRESVCTDHDNCILIRRFDSETSELHSVEHKKSGFTSDEELMLHQKKVEQLSQEVNDLAADALVYSIMEAEAEEL